MASQLPVLFSPNPSHKSPLLAAQSLKSTQLIPRTVLIQPIKSKSQRWRRHSFAVVRCSNDDEDKGGGGGGGGAKKWVSWIPVGAGFSPENMLKMISGATSSPICQFIDSPKTFLHSLDPRIKLVWLLALVILPARSNIYMRFGLVLYLSLLSMWILPKHVWMDQLGRVAFFSGILFIMLGFGSDGVPPIVQLRTPPPSMIGLSSLPSSLGGYSYSIMKIGPLQLTRKGLSLASTSACLSFTIFQSASLCLATTMPEQLASALRWFMAPLVLIRVPVAEIILTLLLSLRFINIVFDEVRNAALGIVARRISWQQLTVMETIDVFFMYISRIFKNIFSHAEQISKAMIARGFLGDSNSHKIYLFSESRLGFIDFFSLLCLLGVVGAAVLSEQPGISSLSEEKLRETLGYQDGAHAYNFLHVELSFTRFSCDSREMTH